MKKQNSEMGQPDYLLNLNLPKVKFLITFEEHTAQTHLK